MEPIPKARQPDLQAANGPFRLLPDFRLQVGGGTVIAWLQRESAEAKGDLWGHDFPSLFSLCVPGE